MSLHYETTMNVFHRVPLTVAFGGINTCKSLLGKAVLSLVGMHRCGGFKKITDSQGDKLLSQCVTFMLNDPETTLEIKALIMKVCGYVFLPCSGLI